MIRNYFKIAFRNLLKNKAYSFINIFGLALGLTCCLLILMYVMDELSYDKFHERADRIYRINSDIKFGGNEFALAVASDPMGFTLKKDYPQVENAVRFRTYGSKLVKRSEGNNDNFKEDKVIFADSTLFDVFTFPLIQGDPKTALAEPKSVVITESTARKYFKRTDVVGETLLFDNLENWKITGVMKDIPHNSHINFDFFVSMATTEESWQNNWVSNNFNTYILLKEGADIEKLEVELPNVIKRYVGPVVQQLMQVNLEQFEASGNYLHYTFMPLQDIHLQSNRVAELSPNGNMQYVYIFSAVAFFVLLIACINFMNLATARSAGRAREVGIRKVLGSLKSSLVGQFLTESLLMTLLAFGLALLAAQLLLPWFNQLSGKEIALNSFAQITILPSLLLFVVITGLLAGTYPAFFLSSFQPIKVLKGSMGSGSKSWLRSSLVVFQFITSVLLIIGTIVIYRQMNYIQTKQLGFNKEQVLIISDAYALGDKVTTFKQEVLRENGVTSGTVSGYLPVSSARSDNPYFSTPTLDQQTAVSTQAWAVDYDYVKTMGMEIAQGRDFSRDFPSDSTAVIINESAAKLFNVQDIVGKKIYTPRDLNTKEMLSFNVIGIVKDFHFESLRQNISPVLFYIDNNSSAVSFRLKTDNPAALVSRIENKWKSLAVGQPFNYQFMDESFDEMYRAEQRVGDIFISFAILAIFIACLGLFGLAAFTAEQRNKEIGIRKVLGASVGNLVAMLSKDFIKLVIIAAVIAFPLAWWGMSKWLEDFAYRTTIEWWIFALAGFGALAIALLTVSFQAIRAAVANPVESLKSE